MYDHSGRINVRSTWLEPLKSVTRDVTTSADIVYGKHFITHLSQISLVSAKNDFSGAHTWVPVPGCALPMNGIHYLHSDLTVV